MCRCTLAYVIFITWSSKYVWSVGGATGPWLTLEPPPLVEWTNQTRVSIICQAKGDPSPHISWISSGDGSPLADIPALRQATASNGTLTYWPFAATHYRPDIHSGTIRCSASNSAGTVLSRDVKIRAVLESVYDVKALPGTASVGGVAVLRCVVPLTLKNDIRVTAWVRDLTGLIILPSLQGDGKHHMLASGELYVYNLEKSDQHSSFRCRTRHRLSSVDQMSGNAASISVTEPTLVIGPGVSSAKLGNVAAGVNDDVTIPCLGQGYPVPEIRWSRLDDSSAETPLDDWTSSFGVLVLEKVQVDDSATYRCSLTNSVGRSQYDVGVHVVDVLSVRVEPVDPVVDEGQSVTFKCSYSGGGATGGGHLQQPSVKWFKDGVAVGQWHKYQTVGGNSLRIGAMQRSDQGVFQCFVHGEKESAQGASRLQLGDAPPQLLRTFNEQTLVPGPFVTFKCAALANPAPDFTWLLDNYPLATSDRITQNQVMSNGGEVISYLNISSARVEDGGEYTCLVKNKAGQAVHSSRLNVYGLPYIRAIPKITAVAEADVSIKCPVSGYPILEIIWSKGEKVLKTDEKQTVDHQGSLTVHSVSRASDAGVYTCTARDRQGHTARRDVTLDVVGNNRQKSNST